MTAKGVYAEAARALAETDPVAKCELVRSLAGGEFVLDPESPMPDVTRPGRPDKPELVNPLQVPRRRLGSDEGRAALVHAIAHIEFNAINLALDAACRFREMPDDFVRDWISVAADEARHFLLLSERLGQLGHAYGGFPAHNGLWQMCIATAGSCLDRMALVPRVLEARGLDVTPGMIERLRSVGDQQTIAALEVILREEVRHVAIGTRWFHHCCEREGCDPEQTFKQLVAQHFSTGIRGPFNLDARFAAGFSEAEMVELSRLGEQSK